MRIFILDGNKMTDKKAAYEHIQDVLLLPDYFGKNLDALEDCLDEIDEHTVIILSSKEALTNSLGEYGEKIIKIFRKCSEESFSFVEQ